MRRPAAATRSLGPAADPRRSLAGALLLLVGASAAATADEIEIRREADGLLRLTYAPRSTPPPPPPPSDGSAEGLARLIEYHSERRGLDARLVRAVIRVESNFDPLARSRRGAMGLMQLMPATAAELGVDDVWDPGENIRGGTTYLRRMLDRFGGDLEMALAGYNAGPSSVEKYGRIPPFRETRNYVRKVLRFYRGGGAVWLGNAGRGARPVLVRRDPERGIVIFTPE